MYQMDVKIILQMIGDDRRRTRRIMKRFEEKTMAWYSGMDELTLLKNSLKRIIRELKKQRRLLKS